jgi:hypothetical protein
VRFFVPPGIDEGEGRRSRRRGRPARSSDLCASVARGRGEVRSEVVVAFRAIFGISLWCIASGMTNHITKKNTRSMEK